MISVQYRLLRSFSAWVDVARFEEQVAAAFRRIAAELTSLSDRIDAVSTGGGGYATIQDEGSALAQRTVINFVGAGVTATDGGTRTVVTIPGGGGSGTTVTSGTEPAPFAGGSSALVTVTGQAGILAGSRVIARVGQSSADHNAVEHALIAADTGVVVESVTAGVGFTVGLYSTQRITGSIELEWEWF